MIPQEFSGNRIEELLVRNQVPALSDVVSHKEEILLQYWLRYFARCHHSV